MERRLSMSEAREQLTHLFDQDVQPVTVYTHSDPKFTIVPQELWEGLMETIEVMSDPEQMAELRQSLLEAQAGQGEPLDTVIEELGWE